MLRMSNDRPEKRRLRLYTMRELQDGVMLVDERTQMGSRGECAVVEPLCDLC